MTTDQFRAAFGPRADPWESPSWYRAYMDARREWARLTSWVNRWYAAGYWNPTDPIPDGTAWEMEYVAWLANDLEYTTALFWHYGARGVV